MFNFEYKNELPESPNISPENNVENAMEFNKEKILDILEENGILQYQNDLPVLDMKKFTETFFSKKLMEEKGLEADPEKYPNVYRLMFDALGNMDVVSQDDYDYALSKNEVPKLKPLFNIPVSKEEAFDPEAIKNKEYYLNYWEMFRSPGRINAKKWGHKIKTLDGKDELNPEELFLATEIFRNHQGKKDKEGNLLVLDKETNSFTNITAEWLRYNVGYIASGAKDSFSSNPHKILKEKCGHLLQSGLVNLEDFKQFKTGGGGKYLRKELPDQQTSYRSIDGAQYYIGGKKFIREKIPMRNIIVAKLDDNYGGVIVADDSGKQTVRYIFQLLSEEEKNEKRNIIEQSKGITGYKATPYVSVRKKEMDQRLERYAITKEVPIKKNETTEEYAKRISNLTDYNHISKTSKKFNDNCASLKSGVHNLSWREQQWLSAASYEFNIKNQEERLYNFARKFDLPGLKAFLICEFDIENGEKILNIAETLNEADAASVIAKIEGLVNLAEKEKSEIEKTLFADGQVSEIAGLRAELLQKAQDIIIKFSETLRKKKGVKPEIEKLLAEIENSKIDIELLSAALKTAKENSVLIDPEMIKDLKIETKEVGSEFSEDEQENEAVKNKIRIMTEDNYGEIFKNEEGIADEQAVKEILKNLEANLSDLPNRKTYLLTYKDEVLAFLCFEYTSDTEAHGSCLNVAKEVKNLGLGSYFARVANRKEAETRTISMISRANNPFNPNYEKQGFKEAGRKTEKRGNIEVEYIIYRMDKIGNDNLNSE